MLQILRSEQFRSNLSEFINARPGAIYRVIFSFKKEYSLYPCNGVVPKLDAPIKVEEEKDNDEDEVIPNRRWGYYNEYDGGYDDEYDESFNWQERDNPCNGLLQKQICKSEYTCIKFWEFIAKKGDDDTFYFFVTDIVTTKPLSGVTLELYNFQKQFLVSSQTDNNGMATIKTKKTPYLLVAKKDQQRGYLKLDGSSLSLSMFDVKGDVIQKGIKGFIYGDRGVWRPGDSLYLTFILEDKLNTLPENHPVSFELINPRGQVVKHMSEPLQ